MRKSLRLIFLPLMVLSGLFLASCAEEEKGTEEVVDINGLSDIRLSYDGSENATFTVSSTRTWSVSKSGMDWLTVTRQRRFRKACDCHREGRGQR